MKKLRMALIAVALIGVVAVVLWGREQLKIDSCLDNGGRWNSIGAVCEGATE
jgi:hypothetical protein